MYFIQLNLPLPVNENLSAPLYKIIPFSELLTIFLQPIKLNDQNTLFVATLYMYFL